MSWATLLPSQLFKLSREGDSRWSEKNTTETWFAVVVFAHESFEYSAWCNVCQQQDPVLRFSFASWQEVLHASVEPWVVALEGSQRWQYLLSSAPVPGYSMLGILSDNSPSQRSAQQTHKITEAATLIKQLRKRPYREAWGTCKEPWGFAGSLGCLQRRSYAPTNLMCFVHVPISQHAVTRSPRKPCW